ncbi:MAG: integrase core domain-containing protein [Thermoleophilia bacterium]
MAIRRDGRGRWMDNVFIERLWRSVKYEEVYLKGYENITEARRELKAYFDFYNHRRRHQGLADRTPDEVYWSTLLVYATDKTDSCMTSSSSPKKRLMLSKATRPPLKLPLLCLVLPWWSPFVVWIHEQCSCAVSSDRRTSYRPRFIPYPA